MPRATRDINLEVAGQLFDMALVHASQHGRLAYRRAAQVLLRLETPIDALAATGSLRDIPLIGPASERIIRETLEHGASPAVERAIAGSGKADDVREAHAHRTNFMSRAEALRVLRSRAPAGVIGQDDYRGDLQMHTEWSDGSVGVAAMAKAAMERGYGYIGVSDHSYGLKIAHGMSMADAARQRKEIERLNREWDGSFRVFQGIEANITADGGVDMTAEELATFDLVLAAPHSKLRTSDDQTARMLAAVRHPAVRILAHPRGRMYSRQGVLARWDDVFAEAERHDVAIELDGDPYRQDLDFGMAKRAMASGCLFALDSDAHSGAELAYSEYALAHARKAGIPARRIINTWPADQLADWAGRRKKAPSKPSPRRRR